MNVALLTVGLVVLLLGAVAYMYTVTETDTYLFGAVQDTDAQQPYRNFGLPLIVIGLVGAVAGAMLPNEPTRETVITHQRKN